MRLIRLPMLLLLLVALLTGCTAAGDSAPGAENAPVPPMPSKIEQFEDGVPLLSVYVVDQGAVEQMTLEDYLCGVLAGEMKNDWPLEALKAQAILARTFVLRFMTEKESKYEGADVSTDIEEAQAYDASAVNARVRQAVEETRGLVLSAAGELPYAWFHAHSGGKTAGAKEGLNWKDAEPTYTKVAEGHENDSAAPDAAEWSETFTADEIIAAAKTAGASVSGVTGAAIGEKGDSGRAVTLTFGDASVNAPDFRIALGSTRMRSTLLTEISAGDNGVTMSGKGFGHGVGMSQWGAYALAEEGKLAEDIVMEYFQNVAVVTMY
ncbi:MAG: SpoIID/LytB domain-containing protein [Oscillospiraceae bacterium]|jgi:stage II sporulation protein D|nr:SpoIID/LytB domain-containing protein [Oscillospiraceae bacterium]